VTDHNEPFDFEDDSKEPEIWNEYRWERFMQESDMRSEQYRRLLEKYLDHPDRDKIIEKEVGWDWMLDEMEAGERGESFDDEDFEMDDIFDDEMDEEEEWKKHTGYESYEFDSVSYFFL